MDGKREPMSTSVDSTKPFDATALQRMDLLRLLTCGSVDDGKSTLIGRLLYDSKSIFEDQLQAVASSSRARGHEEVNLALLTDGLRAEREQGITIDVAYRYFATPKRKFIIADCPGHVQYTRNMVTGASTASLAIVLIDARQGVIEQTRRHSFLMSLLRCQHLVVAVNKMDLVGYSEARFNEVVDAFKDFSAKLDIHDVTFIPMSALKGDNVVERSKEMPWYQGATLLHHLETVHITSDENLIDPRFPVQWVIRPQTSDGVLDYRGYAGQVASGTFRKGDEVVVLPAGFKSKIQAIDVVDGNVDEAFPPMSVCIRLEDDIDISRGDMLCRPNNQPVVSQDLDAMICWMSETPMEPSRKYRIKHTTRVVRAAFKGIHYRLDVNTLTRTPGVSSLGLNEIGRVTIRTAQPLMFDEYRKNRKTGAFIVIDEQTNDTVAVGMVHHVSG
jgi:bifunctional enzyme CysN/CysC